MSKDDLQKLIRDSSGFTFVEKAVLYTLTTYLDENSNTCFPPSQVDLASMCAVSREHMCRIIRSLKAKEVLHVERGWQPYVKARNIRYVLLLDKKDAVKCKRRIKRTRQVECDQTPVVMVPKSGWIYVIRSGRYFKIGRSKRVTERLGEYTHLAEDVTILVCEQVQNVDVIEKELHVAFSEKRMRGEWFKLTLDDVIKVRNILSDHVVL